MRIGERGYYSLAQNEAYVIAIRGKTKKMSCLKYYADMTPYGPFSIAGDYIVGEPGTTIKGLVICVWVAD